MLDPQQNSSRPLISITPRKKSVRFNIASPSPRIPKLLTHNELKPHPLNVSYTIPSTTINIDHITNESHMQHLNDPSNYVPTTRRNHLQIQGEKILPQTNTLDDLHQFMKTKAENLRRNMAQVTTTFINASTHLNQIKEEQKTTLKRPSRIPVSTRYRSPSPTVVIYRKPQHRSLDDLRWYCLARKFSILWQRKIFGCHLQRIKSFYHKQLIKVYFQSWKNIKQYNQDNESVAAEFHNQQLLKACFHTWLNYNSQTQLAIEHINQTRLKNTWEIWKNKLNKRRLCQQQYFMAKEYYRRTILSRVYYVWRISSRHRQQEIDKSVRANYHYRIHLQRFCFNALLTYTDYRRRKNNHKKRVHEYYLRNLLGRIYSQWKQALTRKFLLQQHENRLAQLQERVLTRWAFEQWKSYLCGLADERSLWQIAEQHSDQRVMRSTWKLLHQRLNRCQTNKRLQWIAVQHHARAIKCHYYWIWRHRLEQREDIYLHPEFQKAEAFYHMKITIRYWFCWRRYINDCRQEHAQLKAADAYYNAKLLRKYFRILRNNITEERHENLLEKQADHYYHLRLLQFHYVNWKEQTHIRIQYQMNWRIAVIHDENMVRRKIFYTWLQRAHSRLIDNEQNIVAERHYFRMLTTRAWLTWRQLIDERHNEERSERIAIQFYYHTIQRRVINAWKLYIQHCLRMKQMYGQSEQFYLQHRGKTILCQWLIKARRRRRIMSIVNERFNRKQRLILRLYFRQWQSTVQDEKDERQSSQYAVDHYNRLLKRKVLLAWNNEMVQQVLIDNENEMKLNKYREEKNHFHVKILYDKWKQKTEDRLHNTFLSQRSQIFYDQKLLQKFFSEWKEYHHFTLRLKLIEQQALWFDRMRIVSRIFIQWREAWQSEQRLNHAKQRALLFWALQLQKKCFVNWLIYTNDCKRKKQRYIEATHQRHDELIRKCLRQFLIYTDHTKQRRQALFIHQQVYLYHDRNALAAKYVSKWRAFVKESIQRKQLTQRFMQRSTNNASAITNQLVPVKFDSSPPKLTNRPRPRKPDFLSDSFSTADANKTQLELPIIRLDKTSSSPVPVQAPLPPTIDHSVHSPFVSFQQSINPPREISTSPLLLPPSAFQIDTTEVKMPLSSRRIVDNKGHLSHRSYSTQPSTNIINKKDDLLNVKQRLEIYLQNRARLKRLRQELANLSSEESERQLEIEQECQQIMAFITSEKVQLTSVLQNL